MGHRVPVQRLTYLKKNVTGALKESLGKVSPLRPSNPDAA